MCGHSRDPGLTRMFTALRSAPDQAQKTVRAAATRHGLCHESAPRRFRQDDVFFFVVVLGAAEEVVCFFFFFVCFVVVGCVVWVPFCMVLVPWALALVVARSGAEKAIPRAKLRAASNDLVMVCFLSC